MTTYNTYQEAKIENQDSEIVTTGKDWDGRSDLIGKFEAFVCEGLGFHGLGDTSWVECNPADYCMTVEKFLADGHKFVEGDLFIGASSDVVDVEHGEHLYEMHAAHGLDKYRYILRAAALEDNPSHKVEPTIESEQAYIDVLWQACSELSCDVGHLLINIKGLMKTNKEYASAIASHGVNKEKPRTKVEYVKCEFDSAWEAVKAFEDGEKLHTKRSNKDFILIDNAPDVLRFLYDLHKRIETETDERQEFIDAACDALDWDMQGRLGKLYDSGKFKLVK